MGGKGGVGVLTLGSLFDGIAGFPESASRHDIKSLWASEIEPFCIKVSQAHFPDMKHLGSVTDIAMCTVSTHFKGQDLNCYITNAKDGIIEPVDIITFGSPCQDLSVAGKREGLKGERSHLFFEAVRVIREMRDVTNGIYPTFAIWENVPGALSSHGGRDFRAVLEALTEAEIPMPHSGKWADAGMVRGNGREVAWRLLDAQYWGVPQRRKRIFLVADFGGQRASEILFECQGLPRNIAESRKAGKEAAACIGDGVERTGRVFYESGPGWISEGVGCLRAEGENRPSRPTHTVLEPVAQCVTTGTGRRYDPERETLITVPVLADQGGSQMSVSYDVSPTLRAQEHGHQPLIVDNQPIAYGPGSQHEVSHAIRAQASKADKPDSTTYIVHPKTTGTLCASGAGMSRPAGIGSETDLLVATAYDPKDLGRRPATFENISPTLKARAGTGGNNIPVTLIERNESNNGNTNQTYAREILRNLRDKIGAEAFAEWELGVLVALQQKEILQSEVYGRGIQEQAEKRKSSMDDSTLPCEEFSSAGAMLSVWERECQRCSPQRRKMEEQRTGEPGKDLPELSHIKTQAEKILLNMWETGQGAWILREAFTEIQEVRRSDDGKSQPIFPGYAVRRLTPLEAERLQGLPDNWTNIPGASDTARYKAIGNSLAIPCVEWIMGRIKEVEQCHTQTTPEHTGRQSRPAGRRPGSR